jgi:histidinol phosphatase-like PHP family hydrolase
VGVEAEVLNPHQTTVAAEHMEMFDYIILSPNHFHLGWVEVPPLRSTREAAEYLLAMHRKAATTAYADIIAHPFAKSEELGDEAAVLGAVRTEEITELVDLAKANGVAFEFRLENDDRGPLADILLELYRQCRNRGCKVAPGSDAHWLERLGHTQTLGPAVQRAGLTDSDFLDLSHRAGARGR